MRAGFSVESLDAYLVAPRTVHGQYPLHFVTADGQPLSWESAKENRNLIASAIQEHLDGELHGDVQWLVIGAEVNWEDDNLVCSHSNKKIEPAHVADL